MIITFNCQYSSHNHIIINYQLLAIFVSIRKMAQIRNKSPTVQKHIRSHAQHTRAHTAYTNISLSIVI